MPARLLSASNRVFRKNGLLVIETAFENRQNSRLPNPDRFQTELKSHGFEPEVVLGERSSTAYYARKVAEGFDFTRAA